jgi:RHS repeat-associated protein
MYEQDSTYLDHWLVNLPRRRMVTSTGADFESTQAPYTRTMEYDYSPAGLLTRQTVEPDLSDYTVSTSYGRNAYGQAETIDTCGGGTTCSDTDKREATIVYDDERHVFPHSVTDAEGYSSILTFDQGLGVPLSNEKHGATGSKVLTGYAGPDGFGRTRVIEEPDSRKTHISYDEASASDGGLNVTTTTDGASTLSIGYDQLGRKVHQYETSLGGAQLKRFWRHDRFGRLQDMTRASTDNVDQFAELTTFTYDVVGRVQSIIPPDSAQPARQACYDGSVSCATDARGYTRCVEYDGRGRVHFASAPVNVIEPCSMYLEDVKNFSGMDRNGVEYIYGPFGALERVIDSATGNVLIDIQEDQLGRPQTRTDVGLHPKTYTYTPFGRVNTVDDGEHTVTFGYDKLDRKISRDESDVGPSTWVWRPDLPDRLDYSLATDGTKTTLDYDAFGRTEALTRVIGEDSLTASVVQRDDFGRPQIVEYPGPNHFQVQNVYDDASGTLKEVDSVPAEGSGDPAIAYWKLDSITDFGQVQHETFGNGYTTTRSYHDFTGLPHTIQTMPGDDVPSEIQDLTYDWDEDGNLKTFTDALGGVSEGYVYDEADRLYTVNQGTTPVQQYGYYDNSGSIYGTVDQSGNGWSYNYTDSPYAVHQITSELGESTFSYTPAGRLSHRSGGLLPELNVDYNPAGKPIKVWGSDESQAVFYGYDADQVKVYKQAPDESDLYFGDLYYRIQQSGGLDEHHYVIGNGRRGIAEVVVEDGTDEPTRIVYLHDDAHDSVQALSTDGTSTEARQFGYFGGNGPDSSSFSIFGYTGHQHEPEHGLIDMGGRWYDPQVGQFLSPDPFVGSMLAPEGFNRYAYALNNPLRFTDPSGYQTCDELSEGCGQGGVGTTLPIGPSEPPPESEPSDQGLQGVGGANVLSPSDFAGSEGAYGMSALTANFSSAAGGELAAMSGGPAASLGDRAAYFGAGVGVGAGTGYLIGRGVLLVCAATGVCTAGVVAVATVAGTAYLISDLLGDHGTHIVRAFTSAGTASDAFTTGLTLSGGLEAAVTRGALSREAGANVSAQLGLTERVNEVPSVLARVIPGEGPFPTLGSPGKPDVFLTAAEDIEGLNPAQIAERLTIPESPTFTIIRFQTPSEGLASPILRPDEGFIGRGFTKGGAREFVLPNGPIPVGASVELLTW